MSNATQSSHSSGDSRRRRSRGGKNRNNNHENRRGGDRENRGERGERGDRGDRGPRDHNRSSNSNSNSNSNRAEEFRPQAPRRTYAPPKLTLWQKLLNMVGLYKAPTPPARGSIQAEAKKPREESAPRPAKSNTRNARTTDGPAAEKTERSGERPPKRERAERGERGERGERSERGSRQGDRPRGGDGSTVESPRVYVGNLSYDVSEQDLQELFKGIGAVRNVEIVYNRSTHRSKGYGFVEMLRMDEAVRSVEVLHDQPFMGRKLIVSGAKSKGQDEREDNEERPEREPRPIVVAPMPAAATAVAATAAATAAVVDAPAATETQAEAEEPVIQTIIENVTPAEAAAEAAEAAETVEATAEAVEAAAPSADDLVSKYGFDEPAEKPQQP
ncbi:MAG: hypothetical protein MUF13_00475 [Akkermansiaceae bacterium]|jgi:hypothetical protein|nr:hypothetical protein [Akkermansiaceae bacterium]